MFVDEAQIKVRAGKGGNGCVAFRREKFVPRGGPSGGDGGDGGSVVLESTSRMNTLIHFRFQPEQSAENGRQGEGSKCTGRTGKDLVLRVPAGTLVYDAESNELLHDFDSAGQRFAVARGGHGGRGNVHFKSARFQTPGLATRGGTGQERHVRRELGLLADSGLVGAPNAGKSSLLARLSAARPKVAPYPFTTLEPVLGVVQAGDSGVVVADLPGLIEGASQGAGLGMAFLRHVRRARVLVHVVDGSGLEGNPFEAFQAIDAELGAYSEDLLERPRIVAFNKLDLLEARELWPDFEALVLADGYEAVAVSAASGVGLRELVGRTVGMLADAAPAPRPEPEETAVLRPSPVDEPAQLFRRSDGAYVVRDARLEGLARKLNFDTPDAADYFQRQLDRSGVTERLERAGTTAGDTVVVGELEFEWMGPGL